MMPVKNITWPKVERKLKSVLDEVGWKYSKYRFIEEEGKIVLLLAPEDIRGVIDSLPDFHMKLAGVLACYSSLTFEYEGLKK